MVQKCLEFGFKVFLGARSEEKGLAAAAKRAGRIAAEGVVGYKPINSDAGGDLYIMDFMGALGIPLVPVHQYPDG